MIFVSHNIYIRIIITNLNCVVFDVYLYKNYIALQLYCKHILILDDRGRIFAQFKCVVSNYEWIVWNGYPSLFILFKIYIMWEPCDGLDNCHIENRLYNLNPWKPVL